MHRSARLAILATITLALCGCSGTSAIVESARRAHRQLAEVSERQRTIVDIADTLQLPQGEGGQGVAAIRAEAVASLDTLGQIGEHVGDVITASARVEDRSPLSDALRWAGVIALSVAFVAFLAKVWPQIALLLPDPKTASVARLARKTQTDTGDAIGAELIAALRADPKFNREYQRAK